MKKSLCLVVGGDKGIGKEIFNLFSKKNINTYVLDIENRKSNKFIQVDLSSKKSLNNALSNKIFKKNKIKNLIFCQRFRGDDLHSHFEVSFFPVVTLIEKLKSKMENNSSVVVINSYVSSYISDDQPLGYQASKASLINLVKFYAVNLGSKKIRFNSILPGTTIKPESKKFYKKNKKYKKISNKIIPLRRLGNTKDIANLVEFLCSDKASYITGQSIYLDGGLSLIGQETVARKLI